MNSMIKTEILEDPTIKIRLKLSALWIAAMFCYIYADILAIYDPWLLEEILQGNMGFVGPITQELKLAVAVLMSIPALMVFFSVVLKPNFYRWTNIVFGTLKTLAIVLSLFNTFSEEPAIYYVYFATIEISITSYIVYGAWTWPKQRAKKLNVTTRR